MTVQELIKLLENENLNDVVVMSKGIEEGSYSPLYMLSSDIYLPDSTYSGEIFLKELTPKLKEEGYIEEDLCQGAGQNCITLWPTN